MKKVTTAYLAIIVSMLVACSPVDKMNQKNQQDINSTINQALLSNQAIKDKAQAEISRPNYNSVLTDLLPNINKPENKAFEKHISISVDKVPAKDFFARISQQLKISILPSPDIKQDISLSLYSVTLSQIFDALTKLYNFDFVKTSFGYYVSLRQSTIETYHLNRLAITRNARNSMNVTGVSITGGSSNAGAGAGAGTGANAQASGGSGSGSSTIDTSSSDKDFWKNLVNAIKLITADDPNSKIEATPETGTLIVKTYTSLQTQVAKYIQKIQQIGNRQVVIEAKVLEVQLNKSYSTGINWQTAHVTFDGGVGKFTWNSTINNPLTRVITLLSQQGKVTVLSSPKVTTMNNQQALIKIGGDRYYVTGVETSTTPIGTTAQQNQNVNLNPFFSGIALDVLPQISDDEFITLHIHPMISRVQDDQRTIKLSDTQTLELPMAQDSVREADEVVRARSGEVVVIGGLMESAASASGKGIPGLADAGIFTSKNDTGTTTELVILLQASTVKDNSWIDQLSKANADMKSLNGLDVG
ncbi:MAG: pilus type biosis protein MshL [Gammaproteobacteria bacterium]|jgi:MSHA biogenesis protein MshL|nr:pilus type biosis protein MshL [Gammaproteobacteria bacterium]